MALTQISTEGIKNGTITGADLATSFATTGDFTFTGETSGYNAVWDKSDNALEFAENAKAKFGATLTIYKSSSHAIIDNEFETGSYLRIGSANGVIIGSPLSHNQVMIRGYVNGAAELYFSGTRKLATTTNGCSLQGAQQDLQGDVKFDNQANPGMDLRWDESLNRLHFEQDNIKAVFGTSSDFEIYHDGSTNVINGLYHPIELRHQSEVHIKCVDDGAVELYHNNVKKFETTSAGVEITGTGTNTVEINGNGGHELYSYHDSAGVGWATGTGESGNYGELIYLAESGSQIQFYTGGSLRQKVLSTGIEVTGQISATSHIDIPDSGKLLLGTGDDLQIYHDGTNSYIQNSTGDLRYKAAAQQFIASNDENMIIANQNGAVELYYDNSKKFETTSAGGTLHGELNATGANFTDDGQSSPIVSVLADDNNPWGIQVGNSTYSNNAQHGWQVYVNNSGEVFNYNIGSSTYNDWNWYLSNSSASKQMMKFESSTLAVELYHNNSKKLNTAADGIDVTGVTYSDGLDMDDNHKIKLGTGDDLQIWYDGGHTYIRNYNSGSLNIGTENGNHLVFRAYGGDRWRINTSGHLEPLANNTYDIGTTSARVRNIYTNDLNLSNEGGSNDVDGTWGSYTIQEGAEDLFLVNKRSGKKYKFNLTEV